MHKYLMLHLLSLAHPFPHNCEHVFSYHSKTFKWAVPQLSSTFFFELNFMRTSTICKWSLILLFLNGYWNLFYEEWIRNLCQIINGPMHYRKEFIVRSAQMCLMSLCVRVFLIKFLHQMPQSIYWISQKVRETENELSLTLFKRKREEAREIERERGQLKRNCTML